MLRPRVGDTRTFERYNGKWEIKEIIDNKILNLPLTLDSVVCPKCGYVIGENRIYTFRYIEKLQNGNQTIYLGVSSEGRYIVLNDHFTNTEIEKKLNSLKTFR